MTDPGSAETVAPPGWSGVSLRKPQALAGVLGVVRSFPGATATGMRAQSCRIDWTGNSGRGQHNMG